VLKQFRKAKATNAILVATVECFFVLSKSKQVPLRPSPAPVSVTVASPEPEISSLPRKFSKQLNRRAKSASKKIRLARVQTKKLPAQLLAMGENGLEESPQGAAFNIDPYESMTVLDPEFSLVALFPRETPVTIREGVVVAQDYSYWNEELNNYPQVPQLEQARPPLPQKESIPALTQNLTKKRVPETAVQATALPELLTTPEENPQRTVTAETPKPHVPEQDGVNTQMLEPLQAAPSEVTDLIERGKALLKKIQSSSGLPLRDASTAVSSQSQLANRNPVPGVETPRVSTEPVGKVYGKFSLDGDTQQWLDSKKGHVDLRLQKVHSLDPQDEVFVEYRYPERDFFWDGRQVSGAYRLIANFFEPSKSVAVAQVIYPVPLSAENSKKMVIFHVQKNQLEEAMASASAQIKRGIVLSGTVFEANTGDPSQSKTIPHAEIRVVGFPDWGSFTGDQDGTFRIPTVTAQSEYLLSVQAPGYYPTEVVVPVFQTTGYASIHLVSKSHVDTITRFFTKRPQKDQKAMIFGRVFDPETRAPQADREISLSGRKAPPL